MSGHVRWLPAQSSIDLWVRLWAQMARRLNLLGPKFVETIEKPGRYADGGGLYLQVAASRNGGVTKSWLFRYMRGHLSRTGNPKKTLPHEKMLKVLKALRSGLTVHGFRSTFKDCASQQTAYANQVS